MKLITVFPLVLCLLFCTNDVSSQWEEEEQMTMRPITFFQAVLQSDIVQRKIQGVIDLIDLKLHHLRILKDLFTTENLITLRRTLEWGVSATNLLIRILPDNPEHSSVATILHQVLGQPIDEGTDSMDLPIEVDFDNVNNDSFLDPYPAAAHPPVYQNTIDGSSDQGSLGDVFVHLPPTKTPPAPVFENQLRFGSLDDGKEVGGSGDNEALPSEKHNTVVAGPTTTGSPRNDESGSEKMVQVSLKPEELDLLSSYGMDPLDAQRLANLLYQTRGSRAARASLKGEMNTVSEMYGEKSPQAMTLARLIRQPYF